MRILRCTLVVISATFLTAGSNPHLIVQGDAPPGTTTFTASYAGNEACVRLQIRAADAIRILEFETSSGLLLQFANHDAQAVTRYFRDNPLQGGSQEYFIRVLNGDTEAHAVRVFAFNAPCG